MSYPIYDDDAPRRMAVCRDRGRHLYPSSGTFASFEKLPNGTFRRRVVCASCRVACRIEIWDLQLDGTKIVTATLRTHYPGMVTS